MTSLVHGDAILHLNMLTPVLRPVSLGKSEWSTVVATIDNVAVAESKGGL